MAQELSIEAQLKAQGLEKEPNIVLSIDGFPDDIYGAVDVEKFAGYGDSDLVYGLQDLVYGGLVADPRSRDYISLSGTTTRITQQLEVDKGGVGSIQTFNIKLLDPNGELTQKFAPGFTVQDILTRDARVSFIFQGTPFPDASIVLFQGIISQISFPPGACVIRVSHPDQLKRQELFTEIQDELDGAIDSSVTTIALTSTVNMVSPAPDFRTFIVVDDEIIEYTGISGNSLTGCVRGALNTIAASHDDEAETSTMYALSGDGIDIALKLMLSNPKTPIYAALETPERLFLDRPILPPLSPEPVTPWRGVLFPGQDLVANIGVSVGDAVDIYRSDIGDSEARVFFDTKTITEIRKTAEGTEIYFNNRFPTLSIRFEFKSQYNVWPIGLNMRPLQVDVERHQRIYDLYSASFPEMLLYMKSGQTGVDIIEKDLMLPNALYSIPRKGRSSLGLTLPPIAEANVQLINETNVTNPTNLTITRSITSNFYNKVVYKFDEDSLENKNLAGLVVIDEDSINQISFENKPLTVVARGFRRGNGTEAIIRRQAERILDRYKLAAESVDNVQVTLGAGFNIDVADTVIFGSPALQISDQKNGDRAFRPRVMEVINKTFDVGGKITLSLLDTAFSVEGRYGIVSPSSFVQSYSSNLLVLKKSFTTISSEQVKWSDYIGENLLIRNEDFSVSEIIKLQGLSPGNANAIIIDTPTITITENMIVDLANYDEAGNVSRAVHCFFTPLAEITDVTSTTVVEVADPSVFFVGAVCEVHSPDYANISREVKILSISGDELTFDRALSYTPSVGDEIDLIGFPIDESFPYRLI